MYQLAGGIDYPWLIGGDFNMVINVEEKIDDLPVLDEDHEDSDKCISSP